MPALRIIKQLLDLLFSECIVAIELSVYLVALSQLNQQFKVLNGILIHQVNGVSNGLLELAVKRVGAIYLYLYLR